MALSASHHCKTQKVRSRRTKPIRRPMILLECHGRLLPPHCKARNKQLVAPRIKMIPRGSKCFNSSLAGNVLSGSFLIFILRPRETIPKTRTPMGKLLQAQSATKLRLPGKTAYIQKHHLQLTSTVNAPPRIGLKLAQMPKQLTTRPI